MKQISLDKWVLGAFVLIFAAAGCGDDTGGAGGIGGGTPENCDIAAATATQDCLAEVNSAWENCYADGNAPCMEGNPEIDSALTALASTITASCTDGEFLSLSVDALVGRLGSVTPTIEVSQLGVIPPSALGVAAFTTSTQPLVWFDTTTQSILVALVADGSTNVLARLSGGTVAWHNVLPFFPTAGLYDDTHRLVGNSITLRNGQRFYRAFIATGDVDPNYDGLTSFGQTTVFSDGFWDDLRSAFYGTDGQLTADRLIRHSLGARAACPGARPPSR